MPIARYDLVRCGAGGLELFLLLFANAVRHPPHRLFCPNKDNDEGMGTIPLTQYEQ